MKKVFLSVFFTIFCNLQVIFCQSYSTELEIFTKNYQDGKYGADEYQRLAKKWQTAIKNVGGYPELPYNEKTKDVFYEFVFTFDSLDKNTIYNRILEWMSLQYSNLSTVLDYQDYDLGKIIIKGSNPIEPYYKQTKLFYNCTYRFILIENRLKIEISQISTDCRYEEYYKGESIFYDYSVVDSIGSFYPISHLPSFQWEPRLFSLKYIDTDIKSSIETMVQFIQTTNEEYNF